MRGQRHYSFYMGTHSSGITVPVNSQESGWGGGRMTEQRVKGKEGSFHEQPTARQNGPVLQTTHYKHQHAHPKLGEGKSSQGAAGDKGW